MPALIAADFSGKKLEKIRTICAAQSVTLVLVSSRADFSSKVCDVLSSCPVQQSKKSKSSALECEKEMLVLSGFSSSAMDRFLAAIRQNKLYIPIKAIVTPTNISWTLGELYHEVSGEAAAMRLKEKEAAEKKLPDTQR